MSVRQSSGEAKRGRPQRQPTAPLGKLILNAMKVLGLSYKHVVAASERLASVYNNPDKRIGKSTLGNIISGSIRQPGTAKLDSLRVILIFRAPKWMRRSVYNRSVVSTSKWK